MSADTLHTVDRRWSNGITVRIGDKWLRRVPKGAVISAQLCECTTGTDGELTHNIVGTAWVELGWHGQLQDIPARLLDQHYWPTLQSFSALFTALWKQYRDDDAWLGPTSRAVVLLVTLTRDRVSAPPPDPGIPENRTRPIHA